MWMTVSFSVCVDEVCVRRNDVGGYETDHASDGGACGAAPATVSRAQPCAGAAVPPLSLSG